MIKKFLSHIWPEKGFYCIAVPQKKSDGGLFYDQTVCETIDEAAAVAEKISRSGKDCYMAVGTLKERSVVVKKKDRVKTQVRVHENMKEFKSLIMDIDCGEGKPYAIQSDAVQALKSFLSETGLPKPTIVSSGWGLHVYFTLKKPVKALLWEKFSNRLKAAAKYYELAIDNSRTSDKSSVLRVAGTSNYKRDPKPVKVLNWGTPVSALDLKISFDRIKNFIEKSGGTLEIPKTKGAKKELTPLEAIFAAVEGPNNFKESNPASSDLIYSRCNFMKMMKQTGGDIPEPVWRAALMVDRKCDSPDPRSISMGYGGFDESVMLDKLRRMDEDDYAPARCDTIKSLEGHDWCDRCPHSVVSPISLGIVKRADKPPTYSTTEISEAPKGKAAQQYSDQDLSDELIEPARENPEQLVVETNWGEEIVLPDPPYPYKRSGGQIWSQPQDDDGDDGLAELVYLYDMYPCRVLSDKTGIYTTTLKVHLPHEQETTFVMPFHAFTDGRQCGKLLADMGILPASVLQSEMLLLYMRSYIAKIQELVKPVTSHAQLGWEKEGEYFVLPDKTLMESGSYEESGVSTTIAGAVDSFRKKGTLEEWKEVMKVYARPGFEPHAFGHCVGYGSLLLHFTDYDGAIVNIMGGTGSGKTTIIKTINSIFGHPKESMLVHHDKYLAKINRLGVFNSICVTYDEITNILPEEVSDLCYSITQGRGRHRLNQNAEEKQNNTKWKLILASTGNDSLMGKLSLLKHDSSAEAMRVFEYRVDPMNALSKNDAELIFNYKLMNNYGHAGEIFLEYVITHKDEVAKLISHYVAKFDAAAEIQIPERYWSAVVACSLAGGYIANKLNLTNFNMDRLLDWSVGQVNVMRGTVEENSITPIALLLEFMNSHLNNTLVLVGGDSDKNRMRADYASQLPRNSLLIRHEKDTAKAYIDRKAIGEWLKKGGADFSFVKKILVEEGIILQLNTSKILASNSEMPRTGQTKCWLINLQHPELLGSIRTAPSKESLADNVYEMGSVDKSG